MSYMGYYFYPEALESINNNLNVKKRPPSWKRSLTIGALAVGVVFLALFLPTL
jgi:hypothetical protein